MKTTTDMLNLHSLFEELLEHMGEPVFSSGVAVYLNEVYRHHECYLLYNGDDAVGFYIYNINYQPLRPFRVFAIHWAYVKPEYRSRAYRLHRAIIRTIQVEKPDRVIYESRLKRGDFGFCPSNNYQRDFTWVDQTSHESLQVWQQAGCQK